MFRFSLLILAVSANLLETKKERKQDRIDQRRTKSKQQKFADPSMFAKFKKDMQSGAFKGLIRPITPASVPRDQGMPPRIQKARPPTQLKQAKPNSIQFSDWKQRFAGARTSSSAVKPTSRYATDCKCNVHQYSPYVHSLYLSKRPYVYSPLCFQPPLMFPKKSSKFIYANMPLCNISYVAKKVLFVCLGQRFFRFKKNRKKENYKTKLANRWE